MCVGLPSTTYIDCVCHYISYTSKFFIVVHYSITCVHIIAGLTQGIIVQHSSLIGLCPYTCMPKTTMRRTGDRAAAACFIETHWVRSSSSMRVNLALIILQLERKHSGDDGLRRLTRYAQRASSTGGGGGGGIALRVLCRDWSLSDGTWSLSASLPWRRRRSQVGRVQYAPINSNTVSCCVTTVRLCMRRSNSIWKRNLVVFRSDVCRVIIIVTTNREIHEDAISWLTIVFVYRSDCDCLMSFLYEFTEGNQCDVGLLMVRRTN